MGNSISGRRSRPLISDQVIRVGGAIALPALLREHGIDADALIAEAGLQATVFDDPDYVSRLPNWWNWFILLASVPGLRTSVCEPV
jgi:hypothetical protein